MSMHVTDPLQRTSSGIGGALASTSMQVSAGSLAARLGAALTSSSSDNSVGWIVWLLGWKIAFFSGDEIKIHELRGPITATSARIHICLNFCHIKCSGL